MAIINHAIIFVKVANSVRVREEDGMRLENAGGSIVTAGVYLALRIVVPMLGYGPVPPGLAVVLSIAAFMLVQLMLIRYVAGVRVPPKTAALLAVPLALVAVGITILLSKVELPAAVLGATHGFRDLALMLFAALLGQMVSFIVREPNILLPAAVAAAFVDYWSVTWGPLSHLLEKKLALIEAVSVQIPSVGHAMPVSMIGMGDFVFLALFFAVLYRFRMNVAGTFWLGYVLLTISMLVVLHFRSAMPALVPICVAVVVANIRHFKLKRDEVLAIVYGGAFLLVILFAMGVFLFRR